jgi:ATP10 protein
MPRTSFFLALLIVVSAASLSLGQSTLLATGAALPPLQGQTLDDKDVSLPDAAEGRVCLLIMTFSKQAGERSRTWQDHFVKDFPDDTKATSYSVAMLGDAPGFVRGMIRSAMRRGTVQPLRARTVTVTSDSKPWKQRLNLSNDKDVYLLLLNKQGQIAWMQHGDFDPKVYADLSAAAERLAK